MDSNPIGVQYNVHKRRTRHNSNITSVCPTESSSLFKFHNLFDCTFCHNTFENPVILPCSETICSKDLIQLFINKTTIKCPFCLDKHLMPKKGFPFDKKIHQMLELKVNQLDFDSMFPKFKDCKKVLNELNEKISEKDLLTEDPRFFFNDYFAELKSRVDLRRKNLNFNINEYADRIIETINKCELACVKSAYNEKTSTKEFDESKRHLNQLLNEFNSFEINDTKLDEIIIKADRMKPVFDNKLNEYKDTLLNGKFYRFQFNQVNVEEIFGEFKCIESKASKLWQYFVDRTNFKSFPNNYLWRVLILFKSNEN